MAILTDGVNGPVTGRLGNVVFYQVKGQNRARSLPRTPKRGRTPSPVQVIQRTKFKLMQNWLRPLKQLVRIGFGNYAPPKTGHNVAMSHNMRHAIVEKDGEFSVDPTAFRFSAGPLSPPVNARISVVGDTLHFAWELPGAGARLGNARTLLLAYNTTESVVYYEICGASAYARKGALAPRFLGYRKATVCHAYMAFMNVETGEVSDSVYAGLLPA